MGARAGGRIPEVIVVLIIMSQGLLDAPETLNVVLILAILVGLNAVEVLAYLLPIVFLSVGPPLVFPEEGRVAKLLVALQILYAMIITSLSRPIRTRFSYA